MRYAGVLQFPLVLGLTACGFAGCIENTLGSDGGPKLPTSTSQVGTVPPGTTPPGTTPPGTTPPGTTPPGTTGLLGGHFDVDTSSFLAEWDTGRPTGTCTSTTTRST